MGRERERERWKLEVISSNGDVVPGEKLFECVGGEWVVVWESRERRREILSKFDVGDRLEESFDWSIIIGDISGINFFIWFRIWEKRGWKVFGFLKKNQVKILMEGKFVAILVNRRFFYNISFRFVLTSSRILRERMFHEYINSSYSISEWFRDRFQSLMYSLSS